MILLENFMVEISKRHGNDRLHYDNMSVIYLAKNIVFHGKTKQF